MFASIFLILNLAAAAQASSLFDRSLNVKDNVGENPIPDLEITLALDEELVLATQCVNATISRNRDDGDLDLVLLSQSAAGKGVVLPQSLTFDPFQPTILDGELEVRVEVCTSCFSGAEVDIVAFTDDVAAVALLTVDRSECIVVKRGGDGRRFLQGDMEHDLSITGDLEARYQVYPNLVTTQEAQTLSLLAEHMANGDEDLNRPLSPEILNATLSKQSLKAIYNSFHHFTPYAIREVGLRRGSYDEDHHVAMHNDGEFAVFQIKLSGEGGNLNFLTTEGVVEPEWPLHSGMALGPNLVHGLSSFQGVNTYLILHAYTGKGAKFLSSEWEESMAAY